MNNTTIQREHFPWLHWPEIEQLVAAFAPHPDSLRFVGGAVRDGLLGREVQEVDAATTLLPDATMALLHDAGIKAIPTGIRHGTVTAVIGERHIEITTLRKDVSCDGRHADVVFTTDWADDARRRDFTMNALYLTPAGELFDPTGGVADAKAGFVRFIGDPRQRIKEDYLRILRYFRFLSQLGCPQFDATIRGPIYPSNIHIPSYEACADLAEGIDTLSGERIRSEMFKLFALPNLSDDIFCWLLESDVATYIFPDMAAMHCEYLVALEQEFHLSPDPLRRLCMAVSDDQDMPHESQLGILRNRWKLSSAEADRIDRFHTALSYVDNNTDAATLKRLKRQLGEIAVVDALLIAWVTYVGYGSKEEEMRAEFLPLLEMAMQWPVPVFPITGQDLLALGIPPGKRIGQILRKLEQRWEASGYTYSKEQLLLLLHDQ